MLAERGVGDDESGVMVQDIVSCSYKIDRPRIPHGQILVPDQRTRAVSEWLQPALSVYSQPGQATKRAVGGQVSQGSGYINNIISLNKYRGRLMLSQSWLV